MRINLPSLMRLDGVTFGRDRHGLIIGLNSIWSKIRSCPAIHMDKMFLCEACGDVMEHTTENVDDEIEVCHECAKQMVLCYHCDTYQYTPKSDSMHRYLTIDGEEVEVCQYCREEHYNYCSHCEELHQNDTMWHDYCNRCADLYSECDECGDVSLSDDMEFDADGQQRLCAECVSKKGRNDMLIEQNPPVTKETAEKLVAVLDRPLPKVGVKKVSGNTGDYKISEIIKLVGEVKCHPFYIYGLIDRAEYQFAATRDIIQLVRVVLAKRNISHTAIIECKGTRKFGISYSYRCDTDLCVDLVKEICESISTASPPSHTRVLAETNYPDNIFNVASIWDANPTWDAIGWPDWDDIPTNWHSSHTWDAMIRMESDWPTELFEVGTEYETGTAVNN